MLYCNTFVCLCFLSVIHKIIQDNRWYFPSRDIDRCFLQVFTTWYFNKVFVSLSVCRSVCLSDSLSFISTQSYHSITRFYLLTNPANHSKLNYIIEHSNIKTPVWFIELKSLSVYLFICLSVYLYICLSVYLFICISVYLSICLYIWWMIFCFHTSKL